MQKIAYIIPGYQDWNHGRKGYEKIAAFFKARGIKPIHVKIDWSPKERIFENFAIQFLKQYRKPKQCKVYILGFSFGAVAALFAAPKAKPDVLVLCSLSPYFKEDLKTLRPKWLKHWRKRFKRSDYSFAALAPKINAKTYIIAGDREGDEVARRARGARRMIRNSSLTIAKGAKHRISQKEYLIGVKSVIDQL